MNKQTQDKLWNELSEKDKKSYREGYSILCSDLTDIPITVEKIEGITETLKSIFGLHNLNPEFLTYEDVAGELFKGKDVSFIDSDGYIDGFRCTLPNNASKPNICTSQKQAEKLLAINKLLNVAKYLNGDWKPDWENTEEIKWGIGIKDGELTLTYTITYNQASIVQFRTEELAKTAAKILGKETIKLALTTDY